MCIPPWEEKGRQFATRAIIHTGHDRLRGRVEESGTGKSSTRPSITIDGLKDGSHQKSTIRYRKNQYSGRKEGLQAARWSRWAERTQNHRASEARQQYLFDQECDAVSQRNRSGGRLPGSSWRDREEGGGEEGVAMKEDRDAWPGD